MYDNNNYYEAPYDDQAEHDELAEQIFDYMKRDEMFDPTLLHNFAEAINEDTSNQDLQDFIRDSITREEEEEEEVVFTRENRGGGACLKVRRGPGDF